MSVRHVDEYESHDAIHQFRADVASVRSTEATPEFASLSETEKSAATIGVEPEAWKPISWLNQGHYGELLRKNALAGRLTQQIEVRFQPSHPIPLQPPTPTRNPIPDQAFKHISGQ